MKTSLKNFLLIIAFSYVVQAAFSCAAGVVTAIFIPLLGASQWVNPAVSNQKNTFFFFSIKENSNTSTFEGNENLAAGGQAAFKGSFTNHDIVFTYNDNSGKKGTYKGYINDASTEMKLTGDNNLPALTLIK